MRRANPRKKAAQHENYVRELLYRRGAELVIRSGGSYGPADLVAFFPDERLIWLVQVKYVGDKLTEREREALKNLEGSYEVVAVVAKREREGWVFLPI